MITNVNRIKKLSAIKRQYPGTLIASSLHPKHGSFLIRYLTLFDVDQHYTISNPPTQHHMNVIKKRESIYKGSIR